MKLNKIIILTDEGTPVSFKLISKEIADWVNSPYNSEEESYIEQIPENAQMHLNELAKIETERQNAFRPDFLPEILPPEMPKELTLWKDNPQMIKELRAQEIYSEELTCLNALKSPEYSNYEIVLEMENEL